MNGHFDLTLAYPQWQGSGRNENLPRGAKAVAEVCGRYAPVETVPLSDDETRAHNVNRWGAILDQFRSAQAILAEHAPRRVLTAGGDCAVDVAVINYLNALHPDLTVIWIDAHRDATTPETTQSGSFHGMPVSALMGAAPEPMRALLHGPIDSQRFFYVDVRVDDDADTAFQRAHKLAMLDKPVSGPVHVHFDLDVLDPVEFPYLSYREPDGMSVDDAVALVRKIARESEIVGFTVTEFAPANDDEAGEGSKVVARLCDAAAGQ